MAQLLGFRVMVTDDRPEFANRERFPMAEEFCVAPYDRGLSAFDVTPNTAIVVGSRGHHFDDLALDAAVRTSASYVGLLGSKRKTILIYEALIRRGVTPERLKAVPLAGRSRLGRTLARGDRGQHHGGDRRVPARQGRRSHEAGRSAGGPRGREGCPRRGRAVGSSVRLAGCDNSPLPLA